MLKAFLLATSVLVAAPAFAQDVPAGDTTQTQQQTPPANPAPATTDDAAPGTQGAGTVDEAAPGEAVDAAPTPNPAPATEAAQPTPAQPANPAQPGQPNAVAPATAPAPDAAPAPAAAPAPGTAAAAPAPAAQPAATAEQVSQAVGRDFATYDKDANGTLSQAEFVAWVGTLRHASEPTFQAGSAEGTAWLGQAFTASDANKDKSIDKAELTTFLTPKPQ